MTEAITISKTTDIEVIKHHIYEVRGLRVMLDRDLAELYGVETKVLNQAVKRNLDRFPEDFRFQLNRLEVHSLMSQIVVVTDLKSQIVTSSQDDTNMKSQFATSSWGGIRKLPYVFTELGVAMLSSVLRSETAIQVNINIMRAFVSMRHAVAAMQSADMKVEQLAHKVDQMDAHIDELMHEQRDINREQTETNNEVAVQIEAINNALDQLREKPAPKRNKIGYKTTKE